MPEYRITFARSARKELEQLQDDVLWRVFDKIEGLALCPRPRDSKKLRTPMDFWRLRVGDYRVIYGIDDKSLAIDIIAIRHRGDVYKSIQ